MKTLLLLLAALALAPAATAQRAWYVDNDSTHAADFRTVQDAIDAAQAGDTVYVAGSERAYDRFNVTRRLVLIGTGYFLTENQPSTYFTDGARVGFVDFRPPEGGFPGAAGSTMYGFQMLSGAYVQANVLLTRNQVDNQLYIYSACNIFNNYISYIWIQSSDVNELFMTGNIVASNIASQTGDEPTVYIINNTVGGSISANRAIVQHNILYNGGTISGTVRTAALYNMSSGIAVQPDVGQQTGNYDNVDMGTVFVGGESPDGRYQLAPESPARGAGFEGADLGAFGGGQPYLISGLPPVPLIYDFVVGSSTEAGLPVLVRVRVVN